MKSLMREPLLHFLILGAGLFVVYGYVNRGPAETDQQTIVVDREKLLSFVQFRSRTFDESRFSRLINSLPQEDLQRTILDYVREEALYREAKALQLDRNDYVSRLRVVQQMEFITRGFSDARVRLTEQEIQRHYETHKSEYWLKPKVTFTHVFFSDERHGLGKAQELARAQLRKLNQTQVHFEQAPAHGERFLYHVNYVGQEPDDVASHFGPEMQAQLFALEPNMKLWRGPFKSPYGAHLVLLTHRVAGSLPPLAAVHARVEQEAREAALEAQFEESVQTIVKAYKVKVKEGDFSALQTGQNVPTEASSARRASIGMSLARD